MSVGSVAPASCHTPLCLSCDIVHIQESVLVDWALLPLSTKECLVRWFCESEVRFHGDADHGVPFHCLRRGHYATQLDPWCGTLLRPDCTRSEELVQNFHRRVTCHRHTGRSR